MSFLRKQESILSFCGNLLPQTLTYFKWNDNYNKKTGLGAEGEEKAILPSPVDCDTCFYLYHPILSRKNILPLVVCPPLGVSGTEQVCLLKLGLFGFVLTKCPSSFFRCKSLFLMSL
jgi:hypothetical protein